MATISFVTTFNLALSPKQFKFLDTTDWAGQGILTSSVNGCFKITAPSGTVIYNNTDFDNADCDIRIASSLISQQTVALPLDGNNDVEAGTYIIEYTVYNSVALTYYTVTNTYTYEYVQPEIAILQTVDCISPLFTSLDQTDYVVEGITPTIDRTHTIDFPAGSAGEGSPVVGTAASVTTTTFYQGTQTTEIVAGLEYEFSDGLIVIDEIEGTQEIVVDCTYICSIYCCIRSVEQQMMDEKGVNDVEYNKKRTLFAQIMAFVGLAKLSIECGKSDDANGYLDEIRTLSNCTSDCDCSGDEPSLVTGIGGLVNNVVVASGGSPLSVAAVTVGNTTTYTVTLSPSFVNTVNTSKVRIFANAAARTAATPDFNGQLGVQIDTDTLYQALSLTVGDWGQVNFFKEGGVSTALMTKSATSAAGANSQAIGNSAASAGSAANAIGNSASAAGANATAVGSTSNASASGSSAFGNSAAASATDGTAIGKTALASGTSSTSLGVSANASGTNSTSLGTSSTASNTAALAVGASANASALDSTALGKSTIASATSATAVGDTANATGAGSVALGKDTLASNSASVAIGDTALASSANGVAIGNTTVSSGANGVAIGSGSESSGDFSISVGSGAAASAEGSNSIGRDSIASDVDSNALGTDAQATGQDANAIGRDSAASGDSSNAIGTGAIASALNATAIGRDTDASAESTNAIGYGAKARIENTTQINGTFITKKDSAESDYQLEFSSAVATITTAEMNLKNVAEFSLTIPTGSRFYPDSVDLVITNANNVTGQPTVRAGGDVSADSLLAAVATTALTATYDRQRFNTLLASNGQATLTAGVTVGATGTTAMGRFVFKGILIENEA